MTPITTTQQLEITGDGQGLTGIDPAARVGQTPTQKQYRAPLTAVHEQERLYRFGPKVLSTKELLSVLVSKGFSTTDKTMCPDEMAALILEKAGDKHPNMLRGLQLLTEKDLTSIPGIGKTKAAIILASLELGKRVSVPRPDDLTVVDDPAVAAAAVMSDIGYETREHFAVLCLDVKHRLINTSIISQGTSSETLAHPREVFKTAVSKGAERVIVSHNHPSGNPIPSDADLELTRQLIQGGDLLGIKLLDHVIVARGDFHSIRQSSSHIWAAN